MDQFIMRVTLQPMFRNEKILSGSNTDDRRINDSSGRRESLDGSKSVT